MNSETRWHSIAVALRREMAAHFPEWTDSNDHDPGVTLLSLFAWLAEKLPYERPVRDARLTAAANRLITAASSLAQIESVFATALRVNYFDGKLLSAEDLRDEQTYFRQRLRRVNLRQHGTGVVSGLDVSLKGGKRNPHIEIAPGVAIDPSGEEIIVPECISLTLPANAKQLFVLARYRDQLCAPVPALDESASTQYSRIADSFEIMLAPMAGNDSVTLARLRRTSHRWTVGKPSRRSGTRRVR